MLVKCTYCNKKDTNREEMTYEIVGKKKPQKKYFHHKCYKKWQEEKAFKQKELEELDYLVEVIKKVHQIEEIPNQFFPFLQDIRNGNFLFGKGKKKYKEGVSYLLIADTYLYVKDAITWAKNNKNFEKGAMGELKYGLAIVRDKITIVKKRKEKELLQKKKEEAKKQQQEDRVEFVESEVKYNKKRQKSSVDISDFLD